MYCISKILSCWVDPSWTGLMLTNPNPAQLMLNIHQNVLNATQPNWSDFELRKNENLRPKHDANTSVILIQSGHIFLQIILLIIPEHSIAALNQPELWVRSLCLRQSNTARLCDSQREHHLTPSISSRSPFHPLCFLHCVPMRFFPPILTSLQICSLSWFALSQISIFYFFKLSSFFLIKFGWNYWKHRLSLSLSLSTSCQLTLIFYTNTHTHTHLLHGIVM